MAFLLIVMIKKSRLKKGGWYLGICRNSKIAMWDGNKFVFLKQHFDNYHADTIEHYNDVKDAGYDGFIPTQKIQMPNFEELRDERDKVDYKNRYRNVYLIKQETPLKGEEFKDVPEYGGLYKVSNLGRVQKEGGMIMTQSFSRGYLVLGLSKDGKRKTVRVHRLVAQAFCSEGTGNEVDHINGVKTDNRTSNLRWVSHSENSKSMFQNGNVVRKLTLEQIKEIRKEIKEGNRMQKDIAKDYGVSQSTISEIRNNKKWVLD